MKDDLLTMLWEIIRRRHPRSVRGVEEARAVCPERFDRVAGRMLGWLVGTGGDVEKAVDAFATYSTEVNLAQARYEADGQYQHRSFDEVYADHYSRRDRMDDYLWAVFLSNILWAHHTEISLFFRDRFLEKRCQEPFSTEAAKLVEIAPGHGGWGTWALDVLPHATLRGFDISPSSIDIARSLSAAAGHADRTSYVEQDALDLDQMPGESADALICCFLAEHLEKPGRLFAVIEHLLRPGAPAFVTAALTAAQVDHIYEFRRESELVQLCEDHGMRVLETLCAAPRRTLPKARFLPRSMALIVQKRHNDLS